MSQLLQEAFAKAQSLSDAEQDALGQLILDELADEKRWAEQFARSQEQLSRVAERVRSEVRSGQVRSVGIDEL
jgi:hypothetical protein